MNGVTSQQQPDGHMNSPLQSLEGESMNEKSISYPPQMLRDAYRNTCTNGQVLYLIHC